MKICVSNTNKVFRYNNNIHVSLADKPKIRNPRLLSKRFFFKYFTMQFLCRFDRKFMINYLENYPVYILVLRVQLVCSLILQYFI